MSLLFRRHVVGCSGRSSLPTLTSWIEMQCRGIMIPVYPGGHQGQADDAKKKRTGASRHRKERGQASYKFVDRARIRVSGGDGGGGCLSYERLGPFKKRPDGGNGGHGGAVVIVANPNEQTLGMDKHHHAAEDGRRGGSRGLNGRNGRDKIIRVPCGVVVRRVLDYDEVWDEEERVVRKVVQEEVAPYSSGEDVELNLGTNSADKADNDDDEAHDDENSEMASDKEEGEDVDDEYYFGNDHEGEAEEGSNEGTNEDIESIVNTGIRGPDGMYHWRAEETPHSDAYSGPWGMSSDDWAASTADLLSRGERERVVLADLDKPGSFVVVAGGGRGGTGSAAYLGRWSVGNFGSIAPSQHRGAPGEAAHLDLELKLIADLGLVGFPNAGKSSLLAAMSRARPEIAPYPFTTLHPLVGCIEYRDGFRVVAADVPGLIGGASTGRGRGHDFLRHLERTKALLYIMDAAGVDGRDPVEDLRVLADEIASYGDGDMLTRPALVVANKLDLIPNEEERESILFDIAVVAEEAGIDYLGDVHGISAGVTGEGLAPLSRAIRDIVIKGEENRVVSEAEEFG